MVRRSPSWRNGAHTVLIPAVLLVAALFVPRSQAAFSAQTENTGDTFAMDTLDPATGVVATDGETIQLDWTATVDPYATGYRLYRSASAGGPYSQVAVITPRTLTTYVDSPAEGTYYYVLRSFHGNWDSAESVEVAGWAWRPFDCPADADLRACIRFDTDLGGSSADESGNANTVTHSNGSQIPGISGQAALASPTSHYEMADSVSLDLTDAITMELWVRFDSLPPSGRAGLIDNDGQYSIIYYGGSGLRCNNGPTALPDIPVPVGVWVHVACSWDGATLTLYFDGQPQASLASTGTPDTTNTNPVSLLNTSPDWTEPLTGAIDNLRIWHVGRTQAQICADAGLSGC